MNLSFTSELESALADSFAFFADICSRMNTQQNKSDDDLRLLEYIEHSNNQTVVVLPPSLDEKFLAKLSNSNSIPSEIDNDFIGRFSAFVYDLTSATKCFPKSKLELHLTSNQSNANSTIDLNSSYISQNVNNDNSSEQANLLNPNRKNSLTGNNSNADTQSISSGNNQVTFRKLKQLDTPINVRTKAEKFQAQKRIVSKLNVRLSNNPKVNEKNKHAVAKHHAFYLLSNTYALWFMCLPSYVKDCDAMRKNGLNYAYQILIQMQNHNLTQPDEVNIY